MQRNRPKIVNEVSKYKEVKYKAPKDEEKWLNENDRIDHNELQKNYKGFGKKV